MSHMHMNMNMNLPLPTHSLNTLQGTSSEADMDMDLLYHLLQQHQKASTSFDPFTAATQGFYQTHSHSPSHSQHMFCHQQPIQFHSPSFTVPHQILSLPADVTLGVASNSSFSSLLSPTTSWPSSPTLGIATIPASLQAEFHSNQQQSDEDCNASSDRESSTSLASPRTPELVPVSVDSIKNLTVTRNSEDGKPRYVCPWTGCSRHFTRPYNLRSHYRQHTGERPFACDDCPASFSRQHDLKRHKLIHGGGKQFTCQVCRRSFIRNDALKRHLKPSNDSSKMSKCMQVLCERGMLQDDFDFI